MARKQPRQEFFFFFFLVNLFYSLQGGSNCFSTNMYRENLYSSKDPEGNQHFTRGIQLFPGGGGGVQMLISIETHITCDFPGGGSGPLIPLWIRTRCLKLYMYSASS